MYTVHTQYTREPETVQSWCRACTSPVECQEEIDTPNTNSSIQFSNNNRVSFHISYNHKIPSFVMGVHFKERGNNSFIVFMFKVIY